ncbi:MAG TPA: TIGR03936 family radical SAM-associated protein [candidate division Zixibacteria bacterium]|nr:TIGR03936 family radical SAM-associated protein [candidate division Zixibacteria bacterium]
MEFGRTKKKVASRALAAPSVARLRIRWGRNESQRMLSHLDNMRVIENAIKESNFPVAFSQGSHPRMKLSFCPPLPMGFTTEAEYVDISLDQNCTGAMIDNIRKALPDGFLMLEAKTVFAKTLSLSEAINRVTYSLKLTADTNVENLKENISELLKREQIEINRKTKSGESVVDIRPAVFKLDVTDDELILTLGIGSGGYARPTEVAQILFGLSDEETAALQFHRREMYRETEDNRRIEGIEL